MFQFANSNLLGFFGEECRSPIREQLLGLRVIEWPPNVEPKARIRPRADSFPSADKSQHKLRKIQIFPWFDVAQHARFVDINTHADVVVILGFLEVARDLMIAIDLKHTKVVFDGSPMYCDGKHSLLTAMERNQLVEIQICQQVAIHDQEGIRKTRNKRQRSCSSGRLLLLQKTQRQLTGQFLPMLEIRSDQAGEVAECQSYVR